MIYEWYAPALTCFGFGLAPGRRYFAKRAAERAEEIGLDTAKPSEEHGDAETESKGQADDA